MFDINEIEVMFLDPTDLIIDNINRLLRCNKIINFIFSQEIAFLFFFAANFAVVYIPSESLHLEISNHVAETTKELWIGEIQKKYNVAFMSPSTFSAYCSALLLGFNSIAVEEKALNFLRYKDKLVNMVTDLCDLTTKLNNKIQGVLKSSGELDDKSTQLKLEIERVERTLKEIEKKNLN